MKEAPRPEWPVGVPRCRRLRLLGACGRHGEQESENLHEPILPHLGTLSLGLSAYSLMGLAAKQLEVGRESVWSSSPVRIYYPTRMAWFGKTRTKPVILHIDDDEDTLRFTNILLRELGYEGLMATNGLEGLRLAEKETPDLILLDAQMPDMDGYKACWHLKEKEKTKPIPILMATLEDEMKHVEKAMAYGALGYILKPITRDKLQAKIREALKPASK